MPNESAPPPVLELPEQVRQLEQMGAELARNNQHEDAERIFREVARVAPGHLPALKYLGDRALARGELEAAQEYFERMIRLAPRAAMAHQNLGVVLRARGFPEDALLAFNIALKLRPEMTMGWIQRGDILQALGRHKEAEAAYLRAEELSGNLIELSINARETPTPSRVIARAATLLARAKLIRVTEALAPLRRLHPKSAFTRVTPAIEHMCNAITPATDDPLQHPTFVYFPGLAAHPFFERRDFPFLAALEHRSATIRQELHDAFAQAPRQTPAAQEPPNPAERSSKWRAFYLYRNGERIAEHCANCPATMEIIESLPLARLQSLAPEIFFSILEPGMQIPPVFGPTNCKLVVNLPIAAPERCTVRVGDETRAWERGRCLIFDDSFEHEAWNRSGERCEMLIFELWHPDLSEIERETLATALSALDRFKREAERRTANFPVPKRHPRLANRRAITV